MPSVSTKAACVQNCSNKPQKARSCAGGASSAATCSKACAGRFVRWLVKYLHNTAHLWWPHTINHKPVAGCIPSLLLWVWCACYLLHVCWVLVQSTFSAVCSVSSNHWRRTRIMLGQFHFFDTQMDVWSALTSRRYDPYLTPKGEGQVIHYIQSRHSAHSKGSCRAAEIIWQQKDFFFTVLQAIILLTKAVSRHVMLYIFLLFASYSHDCVLFYSIKSCYSVVYMILMHVYHNVSRCVYPWRSICLLCLAMQHFPAM